MPCLRSSAWYSAEQYWLPRTPFCLSSGNLGLADGALLLVADEAEDLAGNVALHAADGFQLGVALDNTPRHVVLGPLVSTEATHCNDVERAVRRAVATAVEAVPRDLAGRRRNGAHPA